MFTPWLHPLSRHFSTVTGHEYLAMIFPFPVPYLWLPWRFSFCSVLACKRNQCNFRSLASLLILVLWRSFQSTAYVHEYTRVLKVPIYSCYFASATGSSSISMSQQLTLSLLLSHTFVRIVHKFQHFTIWDKFFSLCFAPSITPESTAEQNAQIEYMQGEYQQLRNVCW